MPYLNSNSLKNYLYQHIKSQYPEWVKKIDMEDYIREQGYSTDNGLSRIRELVRVGLLERMENKKGHALYRWLPPRQKSPEEINKESELRLIEATR